MKLFKVECAETGSVFSLRLDSNDPRFVYFPMILVDLNRLFHCLTICRFFSAFLISFHFLHPFSITKFKNQLSLFVSIPPQDQILLIGPPFKRLDPQFGLQGQTEGQRIFLYNKQTLMGDAKSLTNMEVRLPPYDMNFPEPVMDMSTSTGYELSMLLDKSSSPLLRALPDFEKQLLRNLKRGEALLLFSEQVSASCKKCMAEQSVQTDALLAAVSNLQDHYDTTKFTFESAHDKFTEQQDRHRRQLDSFDADLEAMRSIPLHTALVSAVGGAEALASIVSYGYNATATTASVLSSSSADHMQNQPLSSQSSNAFNASVMGMSQPATPRSGEEQQQQQQQQQQQTGTSGVYVNVLSQIPLLGAQHSPSASTNVNSISDTSIHNRNNSTITNNNNNNNTNSNNTNSNSNNNTDNSNTNSNNTNSDVGSGSDTDYPQNMTIPPLTTNTNNEFLLLPPQLSLLDCLPVEKERAWARQCAEVHRKATYLPTYVPATNLPTNLPIYQLTYHSAKQLLNPNSILIPTHPYLP